MSSETYQAPGLTDRQQAELVSRIRKEAGEGVSVKRGKTNGKNVVHVGVLGSNTESRTITSASEWEVHPSNKKTSRNQQFADAQATEALMEQNGD